MKDYFDELDKEIDSLQKKHKNDDIVDKHIILNEWLDWTTENIEKEKKIINTINKKTVVVKKAKNDNFRSNNSKTYHNKNNKKATIWEDGEIRGRFDGYDSV